MLKKNSYQLVFGIFLRMRKEDYWFWELVTQKLILEGNRFKINTLFLSCSYINCICSTTSTTIQLPGPRAERGSWTRKTWTHHRADPKRRRKKRIAKTGKELVQRSLSDGFLQRSPVFSCLFGFFFLPLHRLFLSQRLNRCYVAFLLGPHC